MESYQRKPSVHPIISKLIEANVQEGIAELRGVAGPSPEGSIRLYQDLSLRSYVQFPESAVIHTFERSPSPDYPAPVRVLVPRCTELICVTIRQVCCRAGEGQNGMPGTATKKLSPETCAKLELLITEVQTLLTNILMGETTIELDTPEGRKVYDTLRRIADGLEDVYVEGCMDDFVFP